MRNRTSLLVPLLVFGLAIADESQRRTPALPGRPEVHTQRSDVLQLLAAPITLASGEMAVVGEFPNPGASVVGLRVHIAEFSGEGDTCAVYAYLEWRWGGSGGYFRHTFGDLRLPRPEAGTFPVMYAYYYFSRTWGAQEQPLIAYPQGTDGRVTVENWGDCVPTIDSVQVWLVR